MLRSSRSTRPDPTRVVQAGSENASSTTRERTRTERAEAVQVLAADDRAQAEPAYDSREQRAAGLERAGVEPEVIEAVMLADVSQARPAADAAATPPAAQTATVRPVAPAKQVQLER